MALNPEELDMDTAAMQAKYDQTMREKQSQLEKEDLSDMVAEHAAKQKVRGHRHGDCALCNLYGTGGNRVLSVRYWVLGQNFLSVRVGFLHLLVIGNNL